MRLRILYRLLSHFQPSVYSVLAVERYPTQRTQKPEAFNLGHGFCHLYGNLLVIVCGFTWTVDDDPYLR
jgi:hypothetical protein